MWRTIRDTGSFLSYEVKDLSGILGAQSNTKTLFKEIVDVAEGLERGMLVSFRESYVYDHYLWHVCTDGA